MASLATPLAANAFCEALAFADIHSPYTRFARAVNGITAHARAPRRRFCTQRYAAMPPTRTAGDVAKHPAEVGRHGGAVTGEQRWHGADGDDVEFPPLGLRSSRTASSGAGDHAICTKVNRNTFQKSPLR